MNFDEAFRRLLEHEGGYSDHPADPGGKTRYGITEAVARAHGYDGPMHSLPLDTARRIYLTAYWGPSHADALPPEIRFDVFDAAVNSGVRQSALWLQRSIGGVAVDGIVGPQTIAGAWRTNPAALVARFAGHRLDAMTRLSTWPAFGRGWARRVAANLRDTAA